ncbi:hemolymph lipopolysaccharide-binding protein-like [Osmia lignaria lignaria]|uniref:hemolymph lipopolysaccharide-binding protein-like n=1 Tax=Osmia lignaria lignaria TaxID=1437193 RepID=UPI00402BF208
MSQLSFLVNCIILCVAFRGIFSVPKKVPVLKINETENILIHHTSCPCDRDPLELYWDKLHTRNVNVQSTVCACNLGMRGKPPRDDYIYAPGIGYHKMYPTGETWNTARKICNAEGGQLAIINSYAEALALTRLFSIYFPIQDAPRNDTMFLGIHDLYSFRDWTTVLGEPLTELGYPSSYLQHRQWYKESGQYHCGGYNVGADLMTPVNCSLPHAFFCEIPEITPL